MAADTIGPKARCRRCDAEFRVKNTAGTLEAVGVEAPAPVAKERPAPAPSPAKAGGARKRGAGNGRTTGATELPPGAFNEGDRIGRYEVEGVLGRGGMGTVYKAYDPSGNRHVALKVLLKEAEELDRLRFQREIQVQGNVQHPNIMPIFDSGLVGAQRYYVMELLKDPIDLLHLVEMMRSGELRADPKLRPLGRIDSLVERLVLPMCEAVFHANTHEGVLHRDVKPANVILDRNGLRPLLIDFGVSSILDKTNARLAHLERELPVPLKGDGVRVTGTLVFMPPEQARGDADRRGDVWGLGAILHYIVSGQPPFEPATRPSVPRRQRIHGLQMLIDMARQDGRLDEARDFEMKLAELKAGRERTVEDLQQEVLAASYAPRPAGLDRSLDAIISRAMAKRPSDRYRHAMELHEDLSAWLAARPVQARVQSATAAGSVWYRARLFLRRHRLATLLLLLLVASAVFIIFRAPERGPDQARLAQERMTEARKKLETEAYADARGLLLQSIQLDATNEEAFVLLEQVRRREVFEHDLDRARALALSAREAFQGGRTADAVEASARLREVVEERLDPWSGAPAPLVAEVQALGAFARDEQPLAIAGLPPEATLSLIHVDGARGRIDWSGATALDPERVAPGAAEPMAIRSGTYVLCVKRQKRELYLPFSAAPGATGVELGCPLDPAALPKGMVYVGAGRVRGPLGEADVRPLLWDQEEVSCVRYAVFLDSLAPDERRRRVPREAGTLGALGRPLWDADGDRFVPPLGSMGRPVENISLYDARKFAHFEKKRLPTVAEWAWAATGPDGRVCPLGPPEALWDGVAHLADPTAGIVGVRERMADRSPYGIFGLAGNVSEFTRTLETVGGITGWLLMGGGYTTDPGRALVTETRPVPGWLPLEGVGFRCVREP